MALREDNSKYCRLDFLWKLDWKNFVIERFMQTDTVTLTIEFFAIVFLMIMNIDKKIPSPQNCSLQ